MKKYYARILLFSSIAMMAIFLMGLTSIKPHKSDQAQLLQHIAGSFRNIPIANRHAWQKAAATHPELLIRLSSVKFEHIGNSPNYQP